MNYFFLVLKPILRWRQFISFILTVITKYHKLIKLSFILQIFKQILIMSILKVIYIIDTRYISAYKQTGLLRTFLQISILHNHNSLLNPLFPVNLIQNMFDGARFIQVILSDQYDHKKIARVNKKKGQMRSRGPAVF